MTGKTLSVALLLSVLGFVAGAAASENLSGLAGNRGLSPIITGFLDVSANTSKPIYGKKPLICSEVIGPDTNYEPNNLNGLNVLTPEHYAIHSILKLELDKTEGPTAAYLAKYESLMKDVEVTVVQPPKHGKLLPVQVSDDKVYKGFFFMAEQGYFGRDKIVFSVKYGNGQTVLLTNIVSVVDALVTDRFSLESERAQDPCSTTPSEYKEMRQKNIDEITRKSMGSDSIDI